jgi:hypothetical protein
VATGDVQIVAAAGGKQRTEQDRHDHYTKSHVTHAAMLAELTFPFARTSKRPTIKSRTFMPGTSAAHAVKISMLIEREGALVKRVNALPRSPEREELQCQLLEIRRMLTLLGPRRTVKTARVVR